MLKSFLSSMLICTSTPSVPAYTALDPMNNAQAFSVYHTDDVSNTVEEWISTFTADIGANSILPTTDPSFSDPSYPNGLVNGVVPTRFTTTGTLPAPLQLDTDYYLSPTSGGSYEIYPVATEADIPVLGTAITGENVLPAQNYMQQLNKIVLTTTGTGTHTATTGKTLKVLNDIKSGFLLDISSPSNRHSQLEYKTDADGDDYIDTGGGLLKNDLSGYYNIYGKTMLMKTDRYNARQKAGQKRYVWLMFVAKTRKMLTRNIRKNIMQASGYDVSTNVLTTNVTGSEDDSNNRFKTGAQVKIKVLSGGTIAGGLTEGTAYYLRKITNTTFTLHPTESDADNNTNIIDITSQGTGNTMIVDVLTIGQAQIFNFFIEWIEPNGGGNVLSPRALEIAPISSGIIEGSAFNFTGSSQGEVNGLGFDDLDTIRIWATPETTLPAELTRDTTYYVTKKPGSGSGVCRLHNTMQDAIDSVGIATNHADFVGIKFTSAPVGQVLFEYNDGKTSIVYGNEKSNTAVRMNRTPFDSKDILFMAIDYNPPVGTTPLGYLKHNNSDIQEIELGGTKGLTDVADNDSVNPWTLFNSAQGHVPIDMDFYSLVMGSSATNTLTETEINQMMNFMADKYTISNYTPPAEPEPIAVPFTYDTDTLWWDFKNNNTTETTGVTTTAFVPEKLYGVSNLEQPTKDYQPLVTANGVNFNKDTPRQMFIDNVSGITNGTKGWYFACNVKPDSGNCHLLNIARNSSNDPSRGQLYLTGSRVVGLKMQNNDGSGTSWVAIAPSIGSTYGNWITIEVLVDLDVDGSTVITIWYDGVAQTLSTSNFGTLSMTEFPSTDSSEIIIGNYTENDSDSWDGDLQAMIFQNGVPSDAIRQSISDYLIGERP